MMTKPIRVLVVDDSAFARKVIREVLSRDPGIEVVGIARDGLEALEKIAELRPDVITLDLVMPDLDGLGLLRSLPKESPPKVVVVSVSGSDTDLAIEALQNGAVDLVTKPTPLPTDRLYDLSNELIVKVKTASLASPRMGGRSEPVASAPLFKAGALPKTMSAPAKLVVIGTSTGGPQALTQLFKSLPPGIQVPLAIALHIPAGYTAPLAARLSLLGEVKVDEARDGMELKPGRAVIAPGGMHLRIRSSAGRLYAVVSREPIDHLYHPSVDELFASAASQVGAGALGVILTGMGDDGLRGSRAIRAAGGHVLAESASSCVVYGMPRSVIEDGMASAEAPLQNIAGLLAQYAGGSARPSTVAR